MSSLLGPSSTAVTQVAGQPGNFSLCLNQSCPDNDTQSELPKEKNWPALLILVIILFTVGGNILVIMAVTMEKKLQNATNFFLRSLAVADMLVGILVMPISLINILHGLQVNQSCMLNFVPADYYWPLPNAVCPLWIYLDVLFSTSSIMHLCAISLDRYVGIRYPIQHSRFNSRTTAMLKIAAVWTISIVVSIPIPVIGLLDQDKVFQKGICVLNEDRFVLIGSFIAFFIPLVIMVVSYCLTMQVLQRQASDFLHNVSAPTQGQPRRGGWGLRCMKGDLSPSSTSTCESITILPSQGANASSKRRGTMQAIKNERRASQVLGVVFFLFLVMWCPFFITNIISALCHGTCNEELLNELLNIFVWIGYISSGVNPLIYTLFNKTYRHAFARYIRCHYREERVNPRLHQNSNCRNGNQTPLAKPVCANVGFNNPRALTSCI